MRGSTTDAARPLVSCCLIVRDEAHNLEPCFEAAEPLVDEWIVVDTGSTDGTPKLAERLGARVFHVPWRDDFSFARNASLEQASGTWTLWLDADDLLHDAETLAGYLRQDPEADVLCLLVESPLPGEKACERFWQPRLFRRSAGVRFRYPVHEAPDLDGLRVARAPAKILHMGYSDPEQLAAKAQRALDLLRALPEDHPHRLHFELRSLCVLERWEEAEARARELVRRAKRLIGKQRQVSPDVWLLGGRALLKLGRPAEAARFLVRGLEQWPSHPDLYHALVGVGAVGFLGSAAALRAEPARLQGMVVSLDLEGPLSAALVAVGMVTPEAATDESRNETPGGMVAPGDDDGTPERGAAGGLRAGASEETRR